jgi:glycosyltransferase involved in cell wall biosynthesis
MESKMPTYVLLTAAKNEEMFIEKTIKSVIIQTYLPKKWIIISDGSTDKTDDIIEAYLAENKFIQLIKKKSDKNRNFGSKASAITFAYEKIKDLDFEFIGNLDADVSFNSDYYENILKEFVLNSKLGVAGGLRYDLVKDKFYKLKCAPDSVGGPFQLFSRDCFEKIGGYKPLRFGGIDAVAETSARMLGWEVKHFPKYKIFHHRQTGTANSNIIQQKFKAGLRDYSIGYHPLFLLLKSISNVFERPYIVGSFFVLCGYIWGSLKRYQIPISNEFKDYLRKEQLNKIKKRIFNQNA